MAPKFGTSGLRGLVTDLTDPLIRDYTRAFLTASNASGTVHLGRDLRASSLRIAQAVMETAKEAGLHVLDHGALPTPALALAALTAHETAVMVTGSHIPADRNGLKFYTATGEIGKDEEAAIVRGLGESRGPALQPGSVRVSKVASEAYRERYVQAFGATALTGLKIGIYEHSSVARDLLAEILADLGADVMRFARSETFVSVDTEAVDLETRSMLADWCREHGLDSLVSTDGDADRPMITNAAGVIIPGDVLGPLTACRLGAEFICTPVSSNTLVEAMGVFTQIRRTRIGSPYVIAAMLEVPDAKVVGYEANGGFLLGYEAEGPEGPIAPLMTRDCLLPIVTPLVAMREAGTDLEGLVKNLPQRFTASDRLTDVPIEQAQAWLSDMIANTGLRRSVLAPHSVETDVDLTDGLRMSYADGTIVHLRPSGNAPEFRCYTEADSPDGAATLLLSTLDAVRSAL